MDNTENTQNVELTEKVEELAQEQATDQTNQENAEVKQDSERANQEEISLDMMVKEYSSKTREELVDAMQQLVEKDEYEQMKQRIPLIRNAFNNLPKPEPQVVVVKPEVKDEEGNVIEKEQTQIVADTVEAKFRELYNIYKEKRQQQQEKEEQEKQDNLKKKQTLLEEFKQLLDSEQSLKEKSDAYKAIQDKWVQIGNVPHTEVNNLWASYSFLKEKFYEQVKIYNELRDIDRKKNLDEKLKLCEKVEELLVIEDINESFAMLQALHRQWKEIGPVPSEKNDEVWERFKRASDAINQRRKEYYEKRADELEQNKQKKESLTEKVSEIIKREFASMTDWNKATEEINALFAEWKTIGPVPKNDNETMWAKFKNMIDGFYESRKEMFANNKKQEEENYNKKVALCIKAEEIAKRNDFDAATSELKALQEEWKHIGYVRKNQSEKVWLRFRAACDEFFNRKSESYLQTHKEVTENIQKKESLIEELKNFQFTEDKQKNVEVLKDFQKRWFEVGFTPKEERKRLQQQWDEVINANRDKLQISAEEIASKNKSKFMQTLERLKEQGSDAMQRRINSIEAEIDRMENNLGFLANSKNADLLKKEFENKIARLKAQKDEILNQIKASKQQGAKPVEKTETVEQNAEETVEKTEEN
ncbi:MAG: DUF349 domain-containing protein [Bacteroidales bacterium]|nr:DUF349 domain-containing protein [Bacteroidales bacterium]